MSHLQTVYMYMKCIKYLRKDAASNMILVEIIAGVVCLLFTSGT
jgi:hypothetical protein